jgi:hypothetical protein
MNKRNFLIASILSIFLCGMLLASVGAAHAKTITMYPKMDKTKTKYVGKYKFQVENWKAGFYQELDVFAYKNRNVLKFSKYKVKIYYKENGKLKTTKWDHGYIGEATYFKASFKKRVKIKKVKIKF